MGPIAPGLSAAHAAALAGMTAGQERMLSAAQTLAGELAPEAIIDLKLAEHQVRASAAVAKAADDALGALIDTIA